MMTWFFSELLAFEFPSYLGRPYCAKIPANIVFVLIFGVVLLTCLLRNKWFLLLLLILTVALFVRLGFWQIQRGHAKEAMQQAQQDAARKAVVPLELLGTPQAYQAVSVSGHFGQQLVLLDNQHWQHQFGYHVISPFYSDDGRVVLVDRGWVAGNADRKILPTVKTPQSHQRISGQIWFPALRKWNIGPQSELKKSSVLVIEQADPALTAEFLPTRPEAFLLRLSKEHPYGFVREWPEKSFTPQRHYGYAFQWFAMALTLIVLYVVLNRRKKDDASK